jgi:predicted dipeptidase
MPRLAALSAALLSTALAAPLAAQPSRCAEFAAILDAGAGALAGLEADGAQAFVQFKKVASTAARSAGDAALAERVVGGLRAGLPVPAGNADLAACMLRRYLVARYGERMVSDLQTLVGFRTFNVEGKENWDLPEFVRQREWLAKRAGELGFDFKSYDGRVDEIIYLGSPGSPTLALLTHGDVQGVEGQKWSSPPFDGKLVDGRIIGRGTEDDKGAIVANLYAMAALRDSTWPLRSTVKLLVANGEESSWDEIPYYLARAPMPDLTFAVDAAYPVTFAQKGYGILSFRAEPVAQPKDGDWRVVKVEGGSGMSIIAERGEAVLERLGSAEKKKGAQAELERAAARWAKAHPKAKLTVSHQGDQLKVEAVGRGGHSSAPASGHNALGDLTAFLATLDLRLDAWGALTSFVGFAVGTETSGQALGIAHRDAQMGDMTANLSFVREEKGAPAAHVNIRRPQGIAKEAIEKAVAERAATFARRSGATIAVETDLRNEPHIAPVDGEPVATLLAVWQEVTGQPGKPVAIGGGTQARLFKNGVDFGPATDMEHYRGHGTDEYLTPEELRRIGELNVTAVWRLVGTLAP